MTSVAMFNNKGGVGKTTLTYHLAHMLARLGRRVLAVDLDPQANLTAAFLDDRDLAILWGEPDHVGVHVTRATGTVAQSVAPIMEGLGDIRPFPPVEITDGLSLVPGDLDLSVFEDQLSLAWPRSFLGTDHAALRITTAFHRVVRAARNAVDAEIVLIDVGPNLGAINRAALLMTDAFVVPLAADLFSLRGLRNLGPTLRGWRTVWRENVLPRMPAAIDAPRADMAPLGYVVMQPVMRLREPAAAYQKWLDRMPQVFETAVLGAPHGSGVSEDWEIAALRNYQSLMPLAHDARKPMFDLRPADGAIGSTQTLVQRCYRDFRDLAEQMQDMIRSLDDDPAVR